MNAVWATLYLAAQEACEELERARVRRARLRLIVLGSVLVASLVALIFART